MYIPPLAYPRHLQSVGNVNGCQRLGVNEGVDAHLFEERQLGWSQVFDVVNTRYRFLGSQRMGYHACCHVATLVGGDTHKEVGILYTCFL